MSFFSLVIGMYLVDNTTDFKNKVYRYFLNQYGRDFIIQRKVYYESNDEFFNDFYISLIGRRMY